MSLTILAVSLSGVGRLGKRAIRVLYADLFDIPVSLGAISRHEATVSRALEPIHAAAHEPAKSLDANVNKTSWRQGKAKAWLWGAVTSVLTVFPIHPNRNRLAFDDLVGPTLGVPTTDRFAVYSHLAEDQRQVCWAHLRRDFQAMIDRANSGSAIGEELLAHADIPCEHWQRVRDGTRTHLGWLRVEVQLLLRGGVRVTGPGGKRIVTSRPRELDSERGASASHTCSRPARRGGTRRCCCAGACGPRWQNSRRGLTRCGRRFCTRVASPNRTRCWRNGPRGGSRWSAAS